MDERPAGVGVNLGTRKPAWKAEGVLSSRERSETEGLTNR